MEDKGQEGQEGRTRGTTVVRGGGTTRTSTSGPADERRCESRRASAEPDAGGTTLRGASNLLVGRERDEQLDSCVVRAPWVPWMPHVLAVAAMPPYHRAPHQGPPQQGSAGGVPSTWLRRRQPSTWLRRRQPSTGLRMWLPSTRVDM